MANPHHVADRPVVVHRVKFYGDPERLKFAMAWKERDRRLKNPRDDQHSRLVKAMINKFGISEGTANKDLGGLRAYKQALFHSQLPTAAAEEYEDLGRIALKAEAAGEFAAAVMARRERNKLTGAYAPLQIQVEHTVGPSLPDQLAKMMGVLTKEQCGQLEGILATWEMAEKEGRLQLEAGDDEDEPPADDNEDAEDAEVVTVSAPEVP